MNWHRVGLKGNLFDIEVTLSRIRTQSLIRLDCNWTDLAIRSNSIWTLVGWLCVEMESRLNRPWVMCIGVGVHLNLSNFRVDLGFSLHYKIKVGRFRIDLAMMFELALNCVRTRIKLKVDRPCKSLELNTINSIQFQRNLLRIWIEIDLNVNRVALGMN